MTVATALAHEPLDALIWRVTGGGRDRVAATLAANPGLAGQGVALPEGTTVTIPDAAAAPAALDLIQLWD